MGRGDQTRCGAGRSRVLATLLGTLLLATSCAHRSEMPREQRRECRRLRTRAALRGVGLTVGMAVVVTAVVVLVVATRGGGVSGGGGGSGRRERRRQRRQRRRQVCYELRDVPPEAGAAALAPPVAPGSTADPQLGPRPTEATLTATFEGIEGEVRRCLGPGGVVQIDVAIDGPQGRVTGYAVGGMEATDPQVACLVGQLGRLRFAPFADELRVRFAVDRAWNPAENRGTLPPPPR